MYAATWFALVLVCVGALVVETRPEQSYTATRSILGKVIRDIDEITPDNWTALKKRRIPFSILNKVAFIVTGGWDGSQVLVHTHDNRTYLYIDTVRNHEYRNEQVELRGIRMKDAKIGYSVLARKWDFFVVLTEGGDVYTAGHNKYIQLGYETPRNSASYKFKLLPGVANVTHIATGAYHSMALTQDRQVYYWGHISGTMKDLLKSPMKVNFRRGFVPAQIAAGSYYCMVLPEGGHSIMAWGQNTDKQLGLGEGSDHYVSPNKPQAVQIPKGVLLQSIHGGNLAGFALDVDGRIWGWGFDFYGSLGQGGRFEPVEPTNDMPIMKTKTVAALRVVQYSSIAVTTDNEVYIWGFYKEGKTDKLITQATLVKDVSETPRDVFTNTKYPATGGAVKLRRN